MEMDLVIEEPEKVNVKIFGVVYELEKMAWGDALDGACFNDLDNAEQAKLSNALLERKGIPSDILRKIPLELIGKLMEVISKKKK